MAGLVGVLRQLGDLAEFAAEIFHELHEEVMSTAARGHGLMVRVQQLEVEFPSIEKAFLSQTNHSEFISNPGVEWHPNLHTEQNLITKGDLPRFVMDSYEECRGPPRLFLLDKFDVAGAGACLKRYTDPSFFKVETSSDGRTNAEVQRERKARKTKKKGSRWKNGETPDVLPPSNIKLQQLLLEDRIENGISDTARLVKLKRRPNGFSLDSKSGKSYMDKIINTPLAEDKLVHEISIDYPALKLPTNLTNEKAVSKSFKEELINEKEIIVEEERNGDDHQYDDIASEMDNYVDALATMESEIEMDTGNRAKSDTDLLKADSGAYEEQMQAQFSDSQSVGNSTASDDGNSSTKKANSSFSYSESASTSAENTPSAAHFEDVITILSSNHISSIEEITVDEGLEKPDLVDSKMNGAGNLPFTSKLSIDEVDEEDSSVIRSEAEVPPEMESREVLEDSLIQRGRGEDEAAAAAASANSITSATEEPPYVPALSGFETCHSDATSDGIVSEHGMGPSIGIAEEPPVVLDATEHLISDTADDVYQLESEYAEMKDSETDESSTLVEAITASVTDIEESAIVESGTVAEALAVSVPDTDDAKEDSSSSQSANFTDLPAESISRLEESDEKCIEQNYDEPDTLQKDNQQDALAEWNPAAVVLDDHSDLEGLNDDIIDSPQTAEAENCIIPDIMIVELRSENNDQGSESKLLEASDQESASESPQLNKAGEDDAVDSLSLPTHLEPPHTFEESHDMSDKMATVQSPEHTDQATPAVKESPIMFAQMEKIRSPEHTDEEISTADTSQREQTLELSADEVDIEPVSELEQLQQPPVQTDILESCAESGTAERPSEASESHKLETCEELGSSPVLNLVNEINVEEMPPLPPLPPVQWRMGKMSLPSHGTMEQRNPFPPFFQSNPFGQHSAVQYDNFPNAMFEDSAVHFSPISFIPPTMSSVNNEQFEHPINPIIEVEEKPEASFTDEQPGHDEESLESMGIEVNPPSLTITNQHEEKARQSSIDEQVIQHAEEEEIEVNPPATITVTENEQAQHEEKPQQSSTDQQLGHGEEDSEEKEIEANPPPSITVTETEYIPPPIERGFMWSSSAAPFAPPLEDGKPNGTRPFKLMRPRSPLIDAVAAHDKSKLRKVTERHVQPQIQKVDERDSLLEQIRTKSFNLKPAVATRPSIQGPKTNLRVAAILEKANAIRQALAGSDEDDDEDSWSSD
jgi:hypothetical protein